MQFLIQISPQPNAGAEKPFSYDPVRGCAIIMEAATDLKVEIFGVQGLMAYQLLRRFPEGGPKPTLEQYKEIQKRVVLQMREIETILKADLEQREHKASHPANYAWMTLAGVVETLGISEAAVLAATAEDASPRLKSHKARGGKLIFKTIEVLEYFREAFDAVRAAQTGAPVTPQADPLAV